MVRRILGELPANFSANSSSGFFPRNVQPCFSRVSARPQTFTPKIVRIPLQLRISEPRCFHSNCLLTGKIKKYRPFGHSRCGAGFSRHWSWILWGVFAVVCLSDCRQINKKITAFALFLWAGSLTHPSLLDLLGGGERNPKWGDKILWTSRCF